MCDGGPNGGAGHRGRLGVDAEGEQGFEDALVNGVLDLEFEAGEALGRAGGLKVASMTSVSEAQRCSGRDIRPRRFGALRVEDEARVKSAADSAAATGSKVRPVTEGSSPACGASREAAAAGI